MQRHNQQHEVECNVGYARAEEVYILPFATSLKSRIPIGLDGDTLQDARHGERNPPCDTESPNEQYGFFQGSCDRKNPTVESEDR